MQLGQYNELYDEGFRRCPHCGATWSTYCGSPFIICGKRGSLYDHLSWETINYMVKLQEGKVIIEKGLYNDKNNFNNKTFFYRSEKEKSYSKTQRTNLDYPTNPWLLKAEEKKSMN